MKRKITKLHRGQILKEAADASRLTKEDLANKAGYTRGSYYQHIRVPDLPFHILAAYGKALGVDFTETLPEMPKYFPVETDDSSDNIQTIEEARRQIEHWREKYIILLEQFNKLVLEMKTK